VPPPVSVIVPTRDRPGYLDVALASVAPQTAAAGGELLVVDDGGSAEAAIRAVAARHRARYLRLARPAGLNAARNAAAAATTAPLLAYLDDDVEADPGWLAALLAAAGADPAARVFAGRITARLEGSHLRCCGREGPPITALDLGDADRETPFAWGANLAIRRSALDEAGPFDESLRLYGDEEEWQRRLQARGGGPAHYAAGARVVHRRTAADARLARLARGAYVRGRAARHFDAGRGAIAPAAQEARTVAGCLWHTLRRRCGNGLVMAAHSAGRLHEALAPAPRTDGPDFAAGESGVVGGRRASLLSAADLALDLRAAASPAQRRLARAAQAAPGRWNVLVLSVTGPEGSPALDAAVAELRRSRHAVEVAVARGYGGRGKFENLNALLAGRQLAAIDWLLVVDDDVVLPRGFLDRFLFLAGRLGFRLAQPAHRRRSHAAWRVTRRQGAVLARETRFVEIGPVTAFHRDTFATLLPFPELRMGWGLDVHWAAVAEEHGWPIGVIDAVPIAHVQRPPAAGYSRDEALAEAAEFLAGRPYVPRAEAGRTVAAHRTWR
jgi:GT2 family glycosyltransferase